MSVVITSAGDWVISSHGRWLPGVYEDEKTARWAFRFSDEDLQKLQDKANERPARVITHTDLQQLACEKRNDL